MLKGFVSGEEKGIVRIPMRTRNLLDYNVLFGDNPDRTSTYFIYYKIVLEPNTQYTMITNVPNFQINQCPYMFGTQNVMAAANDSVYQNEPKTITSNSDGSVFIACRIIPSSNPERYVKKQSFDNGTYYIMLNLGSTPLPYEPYGYQEGWEVRDNQDRILWGREDTLQTATGTLPFKGYTLPVKVKSLLGNAVQNGTPAPDNIIIPEMCGVRTGNLFEGAFGGSIGTTGGIAYNEQYEVYYAKVEAGLTYTISGGYYVYAYYSDIPSVGTGNSVDNTRHFTSQGNVITVIDGASWIGVRVNLGDKPMLNLGSTALPYEPYGWKIPFENHGENLNATIPVYLGEVPTVRKIKKLVLTGEENITLYSITTGNLFRIQLPALRILGQFADAGICTHYRTVVNAIDRVNGTISGGNSVAVQGFVDIVDDYTTAADFKSYLATQYAAGTPVTIWYVLANEQTGIVNEPLCKISTYADELTAIQVHGLSAPLYGIGDYKDVLNLSTGVVTRKVKKLVLDGTEGWVFAGDVARTIYLTLTGAYKAMDNSPAICTHYVEAASGNRIMVTGDGRYLRIYDSSWLFADIDAWNTFLAQQYAAGHPVIIWYVLSTPTTETVTVPTGMTGEIEGYLTQVSTPSPTNRSVPKWNGEEETGGTYAVTVYTPPEIPTTTGENTLTVDTTLAPSKLEVSIHAKKIHYGFKIDKSNDDSESAVIYTHDAVTMTPAHMDFTNDRFDYGSWGNAFFVRDCYPVALNLDGTIAYRLDPDDYTKKTDGTPSDIFYELLATEPSDWSTQWKQYYTKSGDEYILNDQGSAPTFATDTYYKLTYTSSFTGNFMMAFPKVWFYRHEDSQYNYIEISNHKLSDDWKCYAHINANGQEVDFIYLPLFKGVIKDSKLRSLPGQIPQGSTTATTEVNAATALGSRWQIWDHSSAECINDLLTLMSKSIDSQGRFGKGRESGYNSSDTVTYGKLQTGTLIKGGKFHGYSATTKEVKVFGIEGFWANRWDRLQGMLFVNNVWKIKMTPPYNFTGTDFVTLSNAEVPTGNGYLSKIQTSEYGSIPASIANGSSTKYFKDYFYKTVTGTRVALRGGNCRSGAFCGFRSVYVAGAASTSDWGLGASPVYK